MRGRCYYKQFGSGGLYCRGRKLALNDMVQGQCHAVVCSTGIDKWAAAAYLVAVEPEPCASVLAATGVVVDAAASE